MIQDLIIKGCHCYQTISLMYQNRLITVGIQKGCKFFLTLRIFFFGKINFSQLIQHHKICIGTNFYRLFIIGGRSTRITFICHFSQQNIGFRKHGFYLNRRFYFYFRIRAFTNFIVLQCFIIKT